jgi:archaellum component FlaC
MPPTIVETDIKDILSKIDNRLECIENDLTDLKINQARMEEKLSAQINLVDEKLSAQINLVDEKLSGQISLVDEKVSGLGKRLEFQ